MTMLEQRVGGCHCVRVRFQARFDLDLLSQCNCSICTKKGILHLPIAVDDFELLRGKDALTCTPSKPAWRSTPSYPAFATRPDHGKRALPRRHRRAEPKAHPLL